MELTSAQKNELRDIADRYGLSLAVLFGSTATGTTHKHSDIDIAVKAKKALTLAGEANLSSEFGRLFSRSDVEIVNLAHVQPLLAKEIAVNGKVLFEESPQLFSYFQIGAIRAYLDAGLIFRLKRQQLKDFLSTPYVSHT
ncbi:MAG: putative nucleotidyltransferase [Parcubacteria group bacterium GW2011_GWC2_45_7]|nr:MAG: putative nucleotidyltransferase [Parcubacteria group bacterium GW2011_GWC2_45_7]KKU73064.1 MAG: putative nucleotidyltransferase [Parcubacteria group bacterium GW2011_GWA2_47_26]